MSISEKVLKKDLYTVFDPINEGVSKYSQNYTGN
jgi:hypothetical protein